MRKIQGSRAVLIAFCCLAGTLPVAAAEVDKYLPEDTDILVTVNVRQILEADLVKKYALEHLKAALKDNEAQKLLQALGFDPLTDVASITVAGPGGDDQEKGLVIVRGKFDRAKLEAKAEDVAKQGHLKIVTAGGHKFYEVPGAVLGQGDKTMFVALVDTQTVVLSPGKSYVTDALDKQAGKKKSAPAKELQGLVEKADGKQSLWLAALASGLHKSALAKDEKAKEVLDKCLSFATGLTIAADVRLEARVTAKNAADAAALAKQMTEGIDQAKGMVIVLANAQKELTPLLDILDSLKIAAQGSSVTVKGLISTDLIEKAIKKVQQ